MFGRSFFLLYLINVRVVFAASGAPSWRPTLRFRDRFRYMSIFVFNLRDVVPSTDAISILGFSFSLACIFVGFSVSLFTTQKNDF